LTNEPAHQTAPFLHPGTDAQPDPHNPLIKHPQEAGSPVKKVRGKSTLRENLIRRLPQCIGLASLILIPNYCDLLSGGPNVRFHALYPVTNICLALITDIVVLGLALFAVRMLLRPTRLYPWARLLVMMLAPPVLLERSRPLLPFNLQQGTLLLLALAWIALLLLLLLDFPKLYKLAIQLGDAVGIFAAAFALCSIVQILVVLPWHPGPQEIHPTWANAQQARTHPRVVWILFDELSYDQTFGHRAHDLALPNLDLLRSQSTLFTDVQPAGFKTAKVIPSLFTGRIVDDLNFRFNNKLLAHYADARGWHPLDGTGTVFDDAKQAGWRTAIAGWYNPYCTVYPKVLDSCYSSYDDPLIVDTGQGTGFWENVWRPLHQIATEAYSTPLATDQGCSFSITQRLKSYHSLQQQSLDLLDRDQADLIFLHLPIPHSPNIWNRLNGDYIKTCGSSYLDNLALVDRSLGAIMAELQRSPRWKDTTLIVQGDHSWRIMLWKDQMGWTDEDDQASHDVFDPRPALLIHTPGQTQPQTDARPLSLLYVHTAIEDALHNTPAQP
jgi:hypothetical protein